MGGMVPARDDIMKEIRNIYNLHVKND
jgi:hypothetical protein